MSGPGPARSRPGRALLDAALYASSAGFAVLAMLAASIPLYREWGAWATLPYAVAAVVAAYLAWRRTGTRGRAWLAIAVLVGAALIPLGVEAARRSSTGLGFHAQSEAIITEEAAKALLHGRNPYATTYLHGPLAARPVATTTHFPYLPGMLVFGVPRAIGGTSPVGDARVWFAAAALAAGGLAVLGRRRRAFAPDDRLLAFQVLAVLPTGALLLATGGDDVPVLALMLLALVLQRDERPLAAGLSLGAAMAMKQTAWLLLPFLLIAAHRTQGARRLAASALAVALAVTLPFVLWNPAAFVEDAIRFPLGLGHGTSAAGTPTLGSMLISAFPGAKVPLTAGFVLVVIGVAVYLLTRRPPVDAASAAFATGIVFVVATILAPSARAGYLAYPIDLLVWAFALRSVDSPAEEERQHGT